MSVERGDIPAGFWRPSEIEKPYVEKFLLEERTDALLVNNEIIVSYARMIDDNKVLVGREKTIPVKPEITGNEIMYPYKKLSQLRGSFGVLINHVDKTPLNLLIGRDYRLHLDKIYRNQGTRLADITIESTKPIEYEFIDASIDYNSFLREIYVSKRDLVSKSVDK